MRFTHLGGDTVLRHWYAILVVLLAGLAQAAEVPLAVVVAKGFDGKLSMEKDIALIYKRKMLFWENGGRIYPVNLSSDNQLRRDFSMGVLKSLPEAQTQYWNNLYYHGISPPHVLASQEAVLRFVSETTGAIGYVSACVVDNRVKVIFWIDKVGNILSVKPEFSCPS